ncbi:hypothetical protein SUGI_0233200 [Cryptomeria japonica]|nr:hypothetical protein SUGI_0233200 [Cryptomeria japonica]
MGNVGGLQRPKERKLQLSNVVTNTGEYGVSHPKLPIGDSTSIAPPSFTVGMNETLKEEEGGHNIDVISNSQMQQLEAENQENNNVAGREDRKHSKPYTHTRVTDLSGFRLKDHMLSTLFNSYSGLRSLNLSRNSLERICEGSLPESLNSLDLSRNKISSTQGFKNLPRLRMLDLSYNRLSCIGHGLKNCTSMKELYLAGNQLQEIDGLRRLTKLTSLDASENRISHMCATLETLATNTQLESLNLLGNPLHDHRAHGNIDFKDDKLMKKVSHYLPCLLRLNNHTLQSNAKDSNPQLQRDRPRPRSRSKEANI